MQQFFQFIILTFDYSSICFERFPAHHQELDDCSGNLWFYLHIVVTVVLFLLFGWPCIIVQLFYYYQLDTQIFCSFT
jgi:hypothetical protein